MSKLKTNAVELINSISALLAFAVGLAGQSHAQPVLGTGGNPRAPVAQRNYSPSGYRASNHADGTFARIPAGGLGINGEVLAAYELRQAAGDDRTQLVVLRVSYNGGQTYSDPIEIAAWHPVPGSPPPYNPLSLGAFSEPLDDGTVCLVYTYFPDWTSAAAPGGPEIYETHSDGSDYSTWSTPSEITSQLVKVDNTGPPAVPDTCDSYDYPWVFMRITGRAVKITAGPNAGRQVFGAYARYVGSGGTTDPPFSTTGDYARFVTVAREPGGSWIILGGLEETTAGNNDMTESSLCINHEGHLIAVIREKGSGYYRFARSTDDGETWALDDGALFDTIPGDETQIRIASNPDDRSHVMVVGIADTGIRANLRALLSTDGGYSYEHGAILFDGYAGYSTLDYLPNGSLLSIFEAANNPAFAAPTFSAPVQMLKQVRFTEADVIAGVPRPALFYFNEKSSGAMEAGQTVFDYGGADMRAWGQTNWSYSGNGIVADGSHGLTLASARTGASAGSGMSGRADSFTVEIVGDFTSLGSGGVTLAGDRSSSGAGWSLSTLLGASGITINDGSNPSAVAANSTIISDGVHHLAAVLDRSAKTLTMYVDGQAGTPVDTTGIGTIVNSNAAYLGMRTDGAQYAPSGVEFRALRFSRQALTPGDFLPVVPSKITPQQYCGYAPTPPSGLPSENADCQLWIQGLQDGGFFCGDDKDTNTYGSLGCYALPLNVGQNVDTVRCPVTRKVLRTNGNARPIIIAHDANVGSYFDHRYVNVSTPTEWLRATDRSFDFIHQGGPFTLIWHAVQFFDHGTVRALFDNRAGVASNAGISILRDTNRRFYVGISRGGSNVLLNTTFTTPQLEDATWYAVAFCTAGGGSNLYIYVAPISGKQVGAFTKYTSAAALAAGTNTDTGSQAMTFGGTSFQGNWAGRDISFYDADLSTDGTTDAVIRGLVEASFTDPFSGADPRMGLEIGIGLGANERSQQTEGYSIAP